MLPEVAAKTAAMMKMTRPERNIRFRPTMSDSLPIGRRSALTVSPLCDDHPLHCGKVGIEVLSDSGKGDGHAAVIL